jgi:hypothetical protein
MESELPFLAVQAGTGNTNALTPPLISVGHNLGNLIDWERGGWYSTGLDVDPESKEASKGSAWKTTYHSARALMRGIQGLRSDDSNLFYE